MSKSYKIKMELGSTEEKKKRQSAFTQQQKRLSSTVHHSPVSPCVQGLTDLLGSWQEYLENPWNASTKKPGIQCSGGCGDTFSTGGSSTVQFSYAAHLVHAPAWITSASQGGTRFLHQTVQNTHSPSSCALPCAVPRQQPNPQEAQRTPSIWYRKNLTY